MDQSNQTETVFKTSRTDVDPVSGNEIPPGAMAEEVRDDVPAMLSEGEYVVPADVLRYYGVKFFEDLRNEAKMGLTEMDAGGRIGGEPVEGGDDLPFSDEELMAIDEEEAPTGFAEGGLNIPEFKVPSYVKAPDMSMFGSNAATSASAGGVEFRTYVNSSGMEITIPFFDGEPLGAIPAGYSLKSGATEAVREEAKQVTANEREPGDGGPANEGRSAASENASSSSGKGLGLSENVADAIGKGVVGLGKAALGSVTGLGPLGIGLASKATDIDEQLAESISQALQGNNDENVSVEDITNDAIAQSTGVSPSSVSSSQSSSRGGGSEGRGGGGNAVGVDGPAPGANAGGNAPGVSASPSSGGASAGAASSAAAGSGHEGNADPDAGGSMLNKGGLVTKRKKKK